MSTPLTVKTQMQSLLNLANETTGKTDVTLTDGVNSLVEGYGQGSGSASVETCTVEITKNTTGGSVNLLLYAYLENGVVNSVNESINILPNTTTSTYTIENVVCGSVIMLSGTASIPFWSNITGLTPTALDGGGDYATKRNFLVTPNAGETATVTFTNKD